MAVPHIHKGVISDSSGLVPALQISQGIAWFSIGIREGVGMTQEKVSIFIFLVSLAFSNFGFADSCQIVAPTCPNYYLPNPYNDNWDGSGSSRDRCLKRAAEFYHWCGAIDPITATYISTGKPNAVRTYPSSNDTFCEMAVPNCPNFPQSAGFFLDDWMGSGSDGARCLQRASEFYSWCGATLPVTATFRRGGKWEQQNSYPPPAVRPVGARFPGQYVAKLFTEVLGRAPDIASWRTWVASFKKTGCSQLPLKWAGQVFFSSSAFNSLGYDNYEKVLVAYRAIMSREPDAGGFKMWVRFLDAGGSIADLVNIFYDSSEFGSLSSRICQGGSYGFGSFPALYNDTIPSASSGYSGNQSGLQELLNRTPPGGTVYLAQRAVIPITSTLTIPSRVTLATFGNPSVNQYAKMARLVRTSGFDGTIILMSPNPGSGGSALSSVWVSGQRQYLGASPHYAPGSILSKGGSGGGLWQVRNDLPWGYEQLTMWGTLETSVPCNQTVSGNLFTNYTGRHTEFWQSAMQTSCDNSVIDGNGFVDFTDGGLVVFGNGGIQSSRVTNNVFYSAGVSAYTALQVEADLRSGGMTKITNLFGNLIFANNSIFTSPDVHLDIALAIGSNAWAPTFAGTGTPAPGYAHSISVTNNRLKVVAQIGIDVNGMHSVFFSGNSLNYKPVHGHGGGACPHVPILVNTPGQASGVLPSSYATGSSYACITGGF